MRIVSGIQPSSDVLHIGNYFGAVRQWLDLQEERKHKLFFFIADLHALTEPTSAEEFRRRIIHIAQDYLALGLDPENCNIFLQSAVPEHTQLMWLLTTTTAMGDLERMTQFKDKSQRVTKEEGVNAGLFLYPVLMAADILLYQAKQVPVGDDQFQHLELAREIARRFNHKFKQVPVGDDQFQHLELAREIARRFNHKFAKNGFAFTIPEPHRSLLGGKIMSLTDPTKKMSKSLGPDSYIGIFDDAQTIKKKIARAVTDSGNEISYDPTTKPGLANLLEIFSILDGGPSPQDIAKTYTSKNYSDLKNDLAQKIIDFFANAKLRREELERADPQKTLDILADGAKDARKIAQKTLTEAYRAVGLI